MLTVTPIENIRFENYPYPPNVHPILLALKQINPFNLPSIASNLSNQATSNPPTARPACPTRLFRHSGQNVRLSACPFSESFGDGKSSPACNTTDNAELTCDRRESGSATGYCNPTLENIRYEIYSTLRSRIQTSCTILFFQIYHQSSAGNPSLRVTSHPLQTDYPTEEHPSFLDQTKIVKARYSSPILVFTIRRRDCFPYFYRTKTEARHYFPF